jgi:Spy/CpxP family protein refolding chaperone
VLTRHFRSAAIGLAAVLIGAAALAGAPAADSGAPPATVGPHHRFHGEFHRVLRQLNLTPEQQTQIKSIFEQAKPGMQAALAAARANHEALMSTAPTDANYPTLLATEKTNAAARVQAMSDMKAQVYAVLTPEQQAKIPQILAADKAARQARIAAWRANHPTT